MREKGRRKKGRTWAEAAKTVRGRERRGRLGGFRLLAACPPVRRRGREVTSPATRLRGARNGAERAAVRVGATIPVGRGSQRAVAFSARLRRVFPVFGGCLSGSCRCRPHSNPRVGRGSVLCLHRSGFCSPVRLQSPQWMHPQAGACIQPRKEAGSAGAGHTCPPTPGPALLRLPGPT
jgi:hypothetical protein